MPPDTASSDPGPTDVVHRVQARAEGSSVSTGDDALRVDVTTADQADGGDVTPEHLMAAALAGCLRQAVVIAATTTGAQVTPVVDATVTLTGGAGHGFSASFDLEVSGFDGLDDDAADALLAQATTLCPFTTALEGRSLTVSRS